MGRHHSLTTPPYLIPKSHCSKGDTVRNKDLKAAAASKILECNDYNVACSIPDYFNKS